jgi:putative (di)nucleoside polyphosphate hydrolase
MTEHARDLSNHRPNVGVVLFNRDGRVFVGRRAGWKGQHVWQFPQGGIDEGEDAEAAARRELYEETGVRSVSLLGRTEGWIAYDFPPEVLAQPNTRGFAGQKQAWFAFRFEGDDSEIDLEAHGEAEFDAWRWERLEATPELAVPFKRDVYDQVLKAFAGFAVPA